MTTFAPRSRKIIIFGIIYWVAVFFVLFLWSQDWEIVQATSEGHKQHLFGLLGFCVFCIIICFAYTDFKSRNVQSIKNKVLLGLPILVSLFFLALLIELSQKSWDYNQYEHAFRSLVAGDNPYLSTRYLYPPFFAGVMVSFYQLGLWLFPLLGLNVDSSEIWWFVFYIHQCSLYFFLIYSYYFSLKLSNKLGISALMSVLFVSALFLFNVPVFRTLSFNQVNFYILFVVLASMVTLGSYPLISGLLISVGGLIKLYPLVFTIPMLVMKKWKALLGIVIGLFLITALQSNFFQDILPWKQFVLFYTSFPMERESSVFRNTSPLSFLRSLFDLTNLSTEILLPTFTIVLLIILIWFAVRFVQRERIYTKTANQQENLFIDTDTFRNIGHLVDFSVISLFVAPSAWEHHYVMAIPLAIWVVAIYKKDIPWLGVLGMVFVFLLPVLNIFPFSYLRMLGVIFLLWLSSPSIIIRNSSNNH